MEHLKLDLNSILINSKKVVDGLNNLNESGCEEMKKYKNEGCDICTGSGYITLEGDATNIIDNEAWINLNDKTIIIEINSRLLIIPCDYCPACGLKL